MLKCGASGIRMYHVKVNRFVDLTSVIWKRLIHLSVSGEFCLGLKDAYLLQIR